MENAGLYIRTEQRSLSDVGAPIHITKNGETISIIPIPYLDPQRVIEIGEAERSHGGLVDEVLKVRIKEVADPSKTVVMSHAFVAGGTESDSERKISIGGTARVAVDAYKPFGYVALGHLHRPQQVGGINMYYSGTPMQYSFSEEHQKSVRIIDLGDDIQTRLIDIPVGPTVVTLTDTLENLIKDAKYKFAENHLVRVKLTDDSYQLNPNDRLSSRFENLIELSYANMKTGSEFGGSTSELTRLSPDEIVENVKKHVNNQQIDDETKRKIINILELTNKDRNTNIPFDMGKKDIPSEFFEVLTSVKLAKLLRANDRKIREVLGIPKKMDLSKSKIMIKIPKRANLPLLDYFISVSAGNSKDEESALKISVKSKVSSPKTNTVKFNSLFDSKQDVDQWYKNLPITSQREQINQKYIAEGAVSVPRGKGLLFPILALNKIIDKNPNIKKVMQKFTRDPKEIKSFRNALKDISSSISTVSQQSLMADVLKNKDDLTNITVIMAKTFNVAKGKTVSKTVGNFNFICEKILEEASQQSSPTKYNFYQMFFDEVLTKKKIAYAVAKVSSKTLVYNYYSLVNFAKEYNDWVALRTKNSVNQLNDALGMDVDERK
jgi:exonuclease SbcD